MHSCLFCLSCHARVLLPEIPGKFFVCLAFEQTILFMGWKPDGDQNLFLYGHYPRFLGGDMTLPAFVIAGTHSGCGKTSVSLGIMAALVRKGLAVQPFKVGPDFIDPGHHRLVTGRESHNLDGWMMDAQYNLGIFRHCIAGADVALIEGVMGLFDGFSGKDDSGSTAQMAKWLGLPVFLVVDARSMARSAAAVVLGFKTFDPDLNICGVILNRIGSAAHREIIEDAMGSISDIPVVGALLRTEGIEIPSRHLGLVTADDMGMGPVRKKQLADWIEKGISLDNLLEIAERCGACDPGRQDVCSRSEWRSQYNEASEKPASMTLDHEQSPVDVRTLGGYPGLADAMSNDRPEDMAVKGCVFNRRVRIAVARDEAFCFYYGENLRLLAEAGAELVPFSPLRDKYLPRDIQAIILGGGYPELYCRRLSMNTSLFCDIRSFAADMGVIYAECGGFMYLMEKMSDTEGRSFEMAGIFPLSCHMEHRFRALGYREIVAKKASLLGPSGIVVRGHEFHYSRADTEGCSVISIYEVRDRRGKSHAIEGFMKDRVLASYIHLHWGSNPVVAENFVDYCREKP